MSVPDLTGDVQAGQPDPWCAGALPGNGAPRCGWSPTPSRRGPATRIDHCAGLIFLDRVAGAHAVYQRKVYL